MEEKKEEEEEEKKKKKESKRATEPSPGSGACTILMADAYASTLPVLSGVGPAPASRFTTVCPARPGLMSAPRAFPVSQPLWATFFVRLARFRAAFRSRSKRRPQAPQLK